MSCSSQQPFKYEKARTSKEALEETIRMLGNLQGYAFVTPLLPKEVLPEELGSGEVTLECNMVIHTKHSAFTGTMDILYQFPVLESDKRITKAEGESEILLLLPASSKETGKWHVGSTVVGANGVEFPPTEDQEATYQEAVYDDIKVDSGNEEASDSDRDSHLLKDIAVLRETVQEIENARSKARDDLAQALAYYTQAKTKRKELEQAVTSRNAEVTSLDTDIKKLQGIIENLENNIAKSDKQIDSAQTSLVRLNEEEKNAVPEEDRDDVQKIRYNACVQQIPLLKASIKKNTNERASYEDKKKAAETELQNATTALHDANAKLDTSKQNLTQHQTLFQTRHEEVQTMEAALEARTTELSEKEAALKEKEDALKEKEDALKEKEAELATRKRAGEELPGRSAKRQRVDIPYPRGRFHTPVDITDQRGMLVSGKRYRYAKLPDNATAFPSEISNVLRSLSQPLPGLLECILEAPPDSSHKHREHHKFLSELNDAKEGWYSLEGPSDWLEVVNEYYGLSNILSRLDLPHMPTTDDKASMEAIVRNIYNGENREDVLERTQRYLAHTVMTMVRVTFVASIYLRILANEFHRQPALNEDQEYEDQASCTTTLGALYSDIERFHRLACTAGPFWRRSA
ncbi:hypothetical protein PG988_005568 [Apiospora saccharicola]